MSKTRIVIVGAGGQASVLADMAELLNKESVILNNNHGLVESSDVYDNRDHYKSEEFIVGVGDNKTRENISYELEQGGFLLGTLVHPKSVVSKAVLIEPGSCVMAGAVINNHVRIGKGVIVNTKSSIDHHSMIGDYTHVAPGSTIAGQCKVGKRCLIGIGAVVSNAVSICDDVIVGAGGVVIKDILEPGTYVGVPVIKVK
jgi:sugar O-acyltransferase (sialic acid O-acetyltransferase NeuD family)